MSKRRTTRVSHITFAYALARMVIGPFSRSDLVEATGLHSATVSKLTHSLERTGAVRRCPEKKPDSKGRKSVEVFELAAKKI